MTQRYYTVSLTRGPLACVKTDVHSETEHVTDDTTSETTSSEDAPTPEVPTTPPTPEAAPADTGAAPCDADGPVVTMRDLHALESSMRAEVAKLRPSRAAADELEDDDQEHDTTPATDAPAPSRGIGIAGVLVVVALIIAGAAAVLRNRSEEQTP